MGCWGKKTVGKVQLETGATGPEQNGGGGASGKKRRTTLGGGGRKEGFVK